MQSPKNEDKNPLLPKEDQSTFQDNLSIGKQIIIGALPNMLTSLGAQLKDVISLYFIGHLNNPLFFAAAGFGITWLNAFGTAVVFGFAAGFGTLASQAYGAKNFHKMGLLYQKSLAVMGILAAVLCAVLWFTETELLLLGFEEELASTIGHFIRFLLIDLVCYTIFETTKFYLIAQNLSEVPACILFISTAMHVFWCHILINVLGLNLVGMAIARTITDATSAGLLLLYIKIKNPNPESWFAWTKECLEGIPTHAKRIGLYGSSIYIEWIAFELTTIILGYLGNVPVLAAHSATLNYLFVNSTISLGLIISTSVHVGNASGDGCKEKAKKYAHAGFILCVIVVTFQDLLMFLFREKIAAFYTSEPNVANYIKIMLVLYFCGMHGDLCCNGLAYLLRTMGQEKFVLKGFMMGYYGIGVTCSLFFGVFMGYGFYGVWGSLIAGCNFLFMFNLYRFLKIDWKHEVNKIHEEMKKKPNPESEIELELI